MNRDVFIKRVIQAGLFALLAMIFLALKNRIVTDADCSACPESGRCAGKKECIRN